MDAPLPPLTSPSVLSASSPLSPQGPAPSFNPSPSFLSRFSRKTWLLIIGLIVLLLAVAVAVALVKQKQLPWIKGVYGPPTGLPPHPVADSLDVFMAAEPPEGEPYVYIDVEPGECSLEITYTYDPTIDVWFQQSGEWVLIIESQPIYPRTPYEVNLRNYEDSHGYDPIQSANIAVITTTDEGQQYRNDVIVNACEVLPTAAPTQQPTATPTEEPTAAPTQQPTATPEPAGCGDNCSYNSDCDGDLVCREVEGTTKCVNKDCPFDDNCVCPAEPTPTPGRGAPEPTPSPTPTSVPATSLPKAEKPKELPPTASVQRTILGLVGGMLLLLIGLAL